MRLLKMNKVSFYYRRDIIAALVAPVLILASATVGYLKFHGYPLLSAEALASMAIVGVIGTLLGGLLALLGPTKWRALALGVFFLIFLDVQFNLFEATLAFAASTGTQTQPFVFVGLLTVFFAALLFSVVSLRREISTIFAVGFATFLLTILLLPGRSIEFGVQPTDAPELPPSDKPLILHLILDGHIGIEGIPMDLSEGPELKETLQRFYDRWGFRLHGRAYSPYLNTFSSVANMLNGTASARSHALVDKAQRVGTTFQLVENRYFDKIHDTGRAISVYQSDILDFCSGQRPTVNYCSTYPAGSFRGLENLELPAFRKAKMILASYFWRSNILRVVPTVYEATRNGVGSVAGSPLPEWLLSKPEFTSLAVPAVIDQLAEDILHNGDGRLYFAHILMPHGPYAWDSQCQLRSAENNWHNRRQRNERFFGTNSPDYRAKAYRDYLKQTLCVTKKLDHLFETMDEAGLMHEATVILHGDHGSRITVHDPIIEQRDKATKADYVAAFSTLYALRSPEQQSGYDSMIQSLPNLFAEQVLEEDPPMPVQQLYLISEFQQPGTQLKPVALPDF